MAKRRVRPHLRGARPLAGVVETADTVAQRAPGGITSFLGFVARRAPLDDARIRRAIAHAVDRRGLAPLIGGIAAAAGGVLPPAMPGHSHRVAPAFDPERARGLLREAGYPEGRGLGEIVLAHFAYGEEEASEIAAQLAAVGLRVRRLPTHSHAELDDAIRECAHAVAMAWDYVFPDPAAGFFEPLLRELTWLYRDERLDALLATATRVHDQDERLRACREFEQIWIGEQAAVVPRAYHDGILWRRPWLTGMWGNAVTRSTFAEAVVRPDRRPDR